MPLDTKQILERIDEAYSSNNNYGTSYYLSLIKKYIIINKENSSLTGIREYVFKDMTPISFMDGSIIDYILFNKKNTKSAKEYNFPYEGDIIDGKKVKSAGIFSIEFEEKSTKRICYPFRNYKKS